MTDRELEFVILAHYSAHSEVVQAVRNHIATCDGCKHFPAGAETFTHGQAELLMSIIDCHKVVFDGAAQR